MRSSLYRIPAVIVITLAVLGCATTSGPTTNTAPHSGPAPVQTAESTATQGKLDFHEDVWQFSGKVNVVAWPAIDDLNGDGHNDVIFIDPTDGKTELFLRNPSVTLLTDNAFSWSTSPTLKDESGVGTYLGVGRLGKTGVPVLLSTGSDGQVMIFSTHPTADGSGKYEHTGFTLPDTTKVAALYTADVAGDGIPDDLVIQRAAEDTKSKVDLAFTYKVDPSEGSFDVNLQTRKPGGLPIVGSAVGDINGDGNPDLVVSYAKPASVAVLFGPFSNQPTPISTVSLQATPTSVATGDFTGDGVTDFVTVTENPARETLATTDITTGDGVTTKVNLTSVVRSVIGFAGVKGGSFKALGSIPISGSGDPKMTPIGVNLADFTGDGKLDLVVGMSDTDGGKASFIIVPGDGQGGFLGGSDTVIKLPRTTIQSFRIGSLDEHSKMAIVFGGTVRNKPSLGLLVEQ